jgi:hypothetical protein
MSDDLGSGRALSFGSPEGRLGKFFGKGISRKIYIGVPPRTPPKGIIPFGIP